MPAEGLNGRIDPTPGGDADGPAVSHTEWKMQDERHATEGGRRPPRAQLHAGPWTPNLRSHRLIANGVGVNVPSPWSHAPRWQARYRPSAPGWDQLGRSQPDHWHVPPTVTTLPAGQRGEAASAGAVVTPSTGALPGVLGPGSVAVLPGPTGVAAVPLLPALGPAFTGGRAPPAAGSPTPCADAAVVEQATSNSAKPILRFLVGMRCSSQRLERMESRVAPASGPVR